MARYYYSGARDTVEGTHRLELAWMKKHGYFPRGGSIITGSIRWSRQGEETGSIGISVNTSSDSPEITFSYRSQYLGENGEWKSMNYSFPLEKIACRFGGYKWFVRCGISRSGIHCGKRVRVLYGTGGYYACRTCANLSYDSCNTSNRMRGYPFGVLAKLWKADEVYASLKRKFYRGKPTQKYRRYLAISYDEDKMIEAMSKLEKMLRS